MGLVAESALQADTRSLRVRPRPHQQHCRSNIRRCRKKRSTCSVRQCCFDIIASMDGALIVQRLTIFHLTQTQGVPCECGSPCSSATPSFFHSRIKTCLFHQSFPQCRSFTSSSRTAFADYCPERFF